MRRRRPSTSQIVLATLFVVPASIFTAHAAIASFDQVARATPAAMAAPAAQPALVGRAIVTPGTTGTTELPALPAGVAPEGDARAPTDATVRAASPFVLGGSTTDQARALECLTAAIYYEAASEPDDGQRAVAQVVLNRVRHPAFPATVCGVVYQGSQNRVCQFSFTCDGALARRPVPAAWARAQRVAAAALNGAVFAPVGLATHYHTYAVTPAWNRGLVMTGVFGAHFFHRWKGYWGTPAAFTSRHAGGEPDVRGSAAVRAGLDAPVAALAMPRAVPVSPADAPVGAAPADRLPESQVRDEWRDSGRPLI
ncbi:cell wall hydrolase [Sphingomonas sp. SFZ2018-12]|uniref:cell wall hydrolase n=1 Tax=Sphingomonas sp. SFZ2018-12 TaxID=2683197 RepID=UPI001F110CF6|nr:cell wall hydrolase [Sphingomonas sp. SFZ2018-12]MCH4894206.1 cell wall hydrolase [Sphingomonas sp. SFZ2018-12]